MSWDEEPEFDPDVSIVDTWIIAAIIIVFLLAWWL